VGYYRKREWSGFAQDSWKATRRLTLEYGARFQHQGWMYEKDGLLFGFDPKLYDPNSPITAYTGLVSPHLGSNVPKSISKTLELHAVAEAARRDRARNLVCRQFELASDGLHQLRRQQPERGPRGRDVRFSSREQSGRLSPLQELQQHPHQEPFSVPELPLAAGYRRPPDRQDQLFRRLHLLQDFGYWGRLFQRAGRSLRHPPA